MPNWNEPLMEHEGVKIYVDQDGKFSAFIEGKHVTRSSVKAIKALIKEIIEPMAEEVYKIDGYGGSVPRVTRVRILAKDHGQYRYRYLKEDGTLSTQEYKTTSWNHQFFMPDESIFPKIEEFTARRDQLDADVAALRESLTPWVDTKEKSDGESK